MKPLLALVLVALLLLALIEAVSLAGQLALRQAQRFDDEIVWLEGFEPARVWDAGRGDFIDRRYRERVERELRAGRLQTAVGAMRLARARARGRGMPPAPDLVAIGLETYTRAADRLERAGRLSAAADWDDTLFVFAVRDPSERTRGAALAAFTEGLDLRVRDGKPCEALARVTWAKRGLGGEIAGFDPRNEDDLNARCAQSRLRGKAR